MRCADGVFWTAAGVTHVAPSTVSRWQYFRRGRHQTVTADGVRRACGHAQARWGKIVRPPIAARRIRGPHFAGGIRSYSSRHVRRRILLPLPKSCGLRLRPPRAIGAIGCVQRPCSRPAETEPLRQARQRAVSRGLAGFVALRPRSSEAGANDTHGHAQRQVLRFTFGLLSTTPASPQYDGHGALASVSEQTYTNLVTRLVRSQRVGEPL
jgi:hypothetical protein